MNADLESLESVLSEVKNHLPQDRETTIFELGCRGYYENPTTDILAFFLNPDAEHGLGDMFISTYLVCMNVDPSRIDMSCVGIKDQVETANGNFIDLQIRGQDWCLIIENKIYHWAANPFKDYEAHAEKSCKGKRFFSILAPTRTKPPNGSATPGLWKPVSYKEYFQKLRERMATRFFDVPFSKWHILAREFILHIENELYNPPMKKQDADFVEKYATEFIQAQDLLNKYPDCLRDIVKEEIAKKVCYSQDIEVASHWAIFVSSPKKWGKACIWLCYQKNDPQHSPISPDGFDILICPNDGELKPDKINADQGDLLKDMEHHEHMACFEGASCWKTKGSLKTRDEAISFIIRLIKLIELQSS